MIVDVAEQVREDPALAAPGVRVFTATPLPIALVGIPRTVGGVRVAAVAVTVVNADGASLTRALALSNDARAAIGSIDAAHFASFGKVKRGFAFALKGADGATLGEWRRDVEVLPGGADAQPGDPSRAFVEKGADQYLKTELVDGVWHYAKMELARDPRINSRVARYTGDYILVNGSFIEVQQQ